MSGKVITLADFRPRKIPVAQTGHALEPADRTATAGPTIRTTASCPDCGAREVFTAVAPPGQRERSIFLRCCWCGVERADLEFYETTQ